MLHTISAGVYVIVVTYGYGLTNVPKPPKPPKLMKIVEIAKILIDGEAPWLCLFTA